MPRRRITREKLTGGLLVAAAIAVMNVTTYGLTLAAARQGERPVRARVQLHLDGARARIPGQRVLVRAWNAETVEV